MEGVEGLGGWVGEVKEKGGFFFLWFNRFKLDVLVVLTCEYDGLFVRWKVLLDGFTWSFIKGGGALFFRHMSPTFRPHYD